jgi:hypothetical protein
MWPHANKYSIFFPPLCWHSLLELDNRIYKLGNYTTMRVEKERRREGEGKWKERGRQESEERKEQEERRRGGEEERREMEKDYIHWKFSK